MEPRITRIMLFCKDVPEVAAFYRDMLGCKVVGEIEAGWAQLDAGGVAIALHGSDKSQKERGKHCNAKIVFGTKDVPVVRAELEAKGVKMGDISSFDGIQICDGADPEGNWFQISSRGMA